MEFKLTNVWHRWVLLPGLILFLWALPLTKPYSPYMNSIAHAGFFNNDLETFEEIVDLVAEKYVYSPDHKKLFTTAIEKMIKIVDSKSLGLTSSQSGSAITFNNKTIKYNLNYDLSHNMDELQKIYYFIQDQSKNSLSQKDLEIAAIRGILDSLDSYSQYLDKSAYTQNYPRQYRGV